MKNLIKSFFVLLTALFSFNYAYGQSVIEDAIKVAPEGWTSVITNGNLANDNVANYLAKEAPSADIWGAAIVKGAGKNNSRGIVVKSADDPAQAWDTQFWIKLNQTLPAGTKLHVEFDYAASQDAKVTTQAHGEPGGYQHWAMIGDVNFTTEWQHFSTDIEVSDDMATGNDGNGLLSIAFNLAEENTATEYYFDNFGVWIHEKDVINDATEHEIDRKFTSVAALEDQLFVIVNEADGKAIYNKDYQNLAYGTYPNAVTGAAYMWRIHSLADETDPEIQSCYTLEAVKTDGSSIGLWGSPAIYLNSGAEGGFDGCFVLGFNDQYGQDVQYGAVWEIEYINGMGFTLKNKARGGYFAGVNPAPAVTNPVYWTFCTLKADAVIPEPGPDPGPGPEPYAPTADGELIPDFFSICDEGNIPYGYIVNFNGEERISSNSYGGGPRMFNFAEGGDFTKALYLREGYIQYGTIKKLPLEAGKKYTVYFNSAMWKDNGYQMTFSIFKENDPETAVLTQIIDNYPNVNGSNEAVIGSTRSEIEFTPETDGNYILKWIANDWREVLLANVGIKTDVSSEDPVRLAPAGWTSLIANGNLAGDNVANFVSKEAPSSDILGAAIVKGAGKGNSRGIVVKSADDPAQAWDTQFWIKLNQALPAGTKLHVEFDYAASQDAKVTTQAHGEPGIYQHWAAIGDINFSIAWQHFSTDIEVSSDMATGNNGNGMLSIAFNLAEENTATEYYFDNFGVWYQEPKPVATWKDIIVNGDMEGKSMECFYVSEQGVGGPYLAEATAAIGKDGSKAVKVQSGDDPSQDWDSQFFIRLPYQLPAGTKYKLSFDYKANKEGEFHTEAHEEPSAYIFWSAFGSGNFSNEWQTYLNEGTISADMSPAENMQTIAIDLALNKVATEFIFDNVKFEVPKDVFETLNLNPATNPIPYALGVARKALNEEIATAEALLADEKGAEDKEALITAINTAKELLTSTNADAIYEGIAALRAAKDVFAGIEFSYEKKYYILNVASEMYWGAANEWGTRASLVKHPEYVKLVSMPDGKYQLESQVSNGGTSYYFDGDYMDGNPVALTIKKTERSIRYYINDDPLYAYTIANDDNYYGWDGTSTVLGKNLTANNVNALWLIIPEEKVLGNIKTAIVNDPIDATCLILDPNFGRNNRNSNRWEGTTLSKSGDNTNMNVQSYMATFDIYQTLTDIPNGIYKVEAQAAVTFHNNRTIKEYDGNGYPVIYANEETANFNEMIAADQLQSQAKMSKQFTAGLYQIEPIFVKVTNGTLIIGAKSDRDDIWAVWDNFEMTYFGPNTTIDKAKDADMIAELYKLRERAIDLIGQVEPTSVISALNRALAASTNVSSEYAIKSAITILKEAIDKAEASITAKDKLAKMKELIDATNVYTEEAYNEYYGQWIVKYQNGSLTMSEAAALQDPFLVTGWHAAITVDNFLLSAWDTNPDFNDAPYYINSWSVEGESDGSDFKVPFFEYWTGDDASLDARTLTATMNGLEKGVYEVTAWVRVRIKNGVEAPTYGITMQANNGKTVNVAAGNQVGNTQMYLKEFTATGTVAEDGVLKIKFNVAADNNISWLSFKNVMFEKLETEGLALTLDIERSPGMGYGVTEATVDFTEAKAFLGVDALSTDMLRIVNPDGSQISDYAPYDGWFNGEGAAEYWGANTKVCVKFFQAIPNGKFEICDMNGADEVGKTYTVTWALTANKKTVYYNINVTFKEAAPFELTVVDKGIATSITYDVEEDNYVEKTATLTDEQVATICVELGISALSEATIYGYNPTTKELVKNFAGFDGWRDANGDFHNWTGNAEAPACVKYTDGQNYLCYNINGCPAQTIKTYWVIANDTKAVLVEIDFIYKAAGAEDPELVAPKGWTSLIANGNLAGDNVANFVSKEAPSQDILDAAIVKGAGKNNSRGIVVKSADDPSQAWDTQFWIKLNQALPAGTILHLEFDYAASQDAKVTTQAHGEPGNYQHWVMIGDVNFTTEWNHFSTDLEVSGDQATANGGNGLLSIAFNLAEEKTATEYYFDNFGVWAQLPEPVATWKDLIVNGDMEGESLECFYVTEQGVGGPYVAEATAAIGKDGSKAVKVQSGDDPSQDWDSQFFIRLPYQLPAGTKYKVSFDYKANKAGDFDTQAHGEPGAYIHWEAIGSGSFTTDWQTYEKEGSISSDMSKEGQLMQTIAFNLAKNKVATEFIFDNVKFEVPEDVVATLTKNPAVTPTPYPITGINTVKSNKLEDTIFNLNGQKVNKAQRSAEGRLFPKDLKKGLYIINGQKVVIK